MFPRISEVLHLQDHILRITFTDGQQADVDMAERIIGRGGVFKLLEDTAYFAQVAVDRESRTLVWPNGVDLDPDVLYSVATGTPLPFAEEQ